MFLKQHRLDFGKRYFSVWSGARCDALVPVGIGARGAGSWRHVRSCKYVDEKTSPLSAPPSLSTAQSNSKSAYVGWCYYDCEISVQGHVVGDCIHGATIAALVLVFGAPSGDFLVEGFVSRRSGGRNITERREPTERTRGSRALQIHRVGATVEPNFSLSAENGKFR